MKKDELSLDRLPGRFASWARKAKWKSLRPIQARCLDWFANQGRPDRDLIVCAPTATGKTEAVFLPVVTDINAFQTDGFEILYICPLKALIDQQARRLKPLMAIVERSVTPWHGEARSGRAAVRRRAEGILIITPESLEKLLREPEAQQMLGGLHAIVIDELHAFFGTPRGVQVISQLARIEHLTGRTVQRFGLSATLAEDVEEEARRFLRPGDPARVSVVTDDTPITAIDFAVESFVDSVGDGPNARDQILHQLQSTLGAQALSPGSALKALVFCNSRSLVEWCASELRSDSRLQSIVYPHHGSLKKPPRDEAEGALRQPKRPAIVVSSPTLELGLDVGEIEKVVQIDPGPNVSSLRQRLGRLMRDLYAGTSLLPACTMNPLAERQFDEAVRAFLELGLTTRSMLSVDNDEVLLFPWAGARVQTTLIAALRHSGLVATPSHIAITVMRATEDAVVAALLKIADGSLPTPEDMARTVKRPMVDKFDYLLGPYLQRRNYASARFDLEGTRSAARALIGR